MYGEPRWTVFYSVIHMLYQTQMEGNTLLGALHILNEVGLKNIFVLNSSYVCPIWNVPARRRTKRKVFLLSPNGDGQESLIVTIEKYM